ncbi:hypothetical protein JGB62_24305, partial [Salmonella enterica subsp. enterica serovar Give]|nr:hypothetical protein [Salmonella enterica subsp. enterica serovar Give]
MDIVRQSPPKHMPKPTLHPKKIVETLWWCATGIIHYWFLKCGETINAEKYCTQLDAMHDKLRVRRRRLVKGEEVLLLHNKARPHVARTTVQKLHCLRYESFPYPAYSPYLSPTDYHFFKHLDYFMAVKRFT